MIWVLAAAAACMFVQDVLGVLLTDAQARDHGWLAGVIDTAAWMVAITTTTITVTALQGHNNAEKVLVVIFVSGANLFGSRVGVALGKRYVR